MPELPQVQALAEDVAARAVGRMVTAVWPASFSVLKTVTPAIGELVGLTVTQVSRRGKFLCLHAGQLWLCVHFARAGWLRWTTGTAQVKPGGPIAMRVRLDEGGFDLTEAGTQKKLAVYVVRDPLEVPGIARLGLEPLDPTFSVEVLAELLAGQRVQLKGLLRDQSVIAGVGNAYSDEVLWAARLSPFKQASTMTDGQVAVLHAALVGTLTDAVDRARGLGAASLKTEKKASMNVHARGGQMCPRCGDLIREVSFASSSLQYCPTCQTGGRPLADRRMSRLLK